MTSQFSPSTSSAASAVGEPKKNFVALALKASKTATSLEEFTPSRNEFFLRAALSLDDH